MKSIPLETASTAFTISKNDFLSKEMMLAPAFVELAHILAEKIKHSGIYSIQVQLNEIQIDESVSNAMEFSNDIAA